MFQSRLLLTFGFIYQYSHHRPGERVTHYGFRFFLKNYSTGAKDRIASIGSIPPKGITASAGVVMPFFMY